MPIIARDVVFGRLGETGMLTLRSAFEFAQARGDAYIEPIHWLSMWLRTDDCDVCMILDHLGIVREPILSDVAKALEKLRRTRSSRLDFSTELELTIERGWVSASLMFGVDRIRTGHLLHGMLETPELHRLLWDISGSFRKLESEALVNRFGELTRGSVEEREAVAKPAPGVGAPAGAPPGKPGQSALDLYTGDLTEQARAGRIDPVVGRDREVREVIDVLMRRRQNNPIVVGEAGVGKTALVEGLALRIAAGDVPPPLHDVRLLGLDLAAMQAGASVRGEFENRLRQVVQEVQRSPKPIVLFIDEAHTLIGAGGTAGTGDAANLLKPALARGTLRTIAATTWAEYKRHIEKDPALTRRFQVIQVDEPEEDAAVHMLRGVAAVLAAHHKVDLLDEAVVASVRLSRRYIQGRQLPDKAVSVLDTACARVAMSQHATPAAVEDARRRIADLEAELAGLARERRIGRTDETRETALATELDGQRQALSVLEERLATENGLVGRILTLRETLRQDTEPDGGADAGAGVDGGAGAGAALEELRGLQARLAELQQDAPLVLPQVDAQAVAVIVESWTGIPVGRMLTDELDSVLNLTETLRRRVVGQDHALERIGTGILNARARLEDPRKPLGVFLLVGPSGVGKTETALALAEILYGGEDHVVSINMSEFQEAHTISTLKGAPPGYVGYGEGGRLTEAVRRKPYSVVLLDEIEKAHPDVHELFFQVFDKGVMEDGEGRRIDFRNTLVLMTSNVGSDLIMGMCAGRADPPSPDEISHALRDRLLRVFPSAFLGRLVVVPYYPLGDDILRSIIRLQLDRIGRRVTADRRVQFGYDDGVVEHVLSRCTEAESGGRMVDAILTGSLLPAISREILQRMRARQPLAHVHVGVENGDFSYAFD